MTASGARSSSKAESMPRSVVRLLGFVGALWMPAEAFAQQPDARSKAEAQKLYEDGARDMETEAYSRACPKFEAAWKILPDHIRTGVTLAECFDKWGKPASAFHILERVLPLAQALRDKAKIAEVEASLADLDQRVPRLTIRVSPSLATMPGLAISRAGTPLPPASWGTPVPLDPGEYEIEAAAVDKPAWKTTVRLSMGKEQTVDITPGWESVMVAQPLSTWPNRVRVAGFVGLGLGAVGLGTWGVLGGLAISKNKASLEHCSADNKCDDEGFNRRKDAILLGQGATVGLIAGGVLMAAGVTLVVISVAGNKETKRDAVSARTNLWVGPSGVGVRGTW